MNSGELLTAIRSLAQLIEKTRYHSHWNDFVSAALSSWRNRNRSSVTPAFEQFKKTAFSVDLTSFPYSQQRALEAIGAAEYFGLPLIEKVESILRNENFDPDGSAEALERLRANFENFTQLTNSLRTSLEAAGIRASENASTVSIQVVFERLAQADNVASMADGIKTWELILRAFAALFELRNEDLRIVSVHKASPLVLEIAAPPDMILALGVTCSAVLVGIERFLRIQKTVAELRLLKLQGDKIAADLEKEGTLARESAARDAADAVVKELGLDVKGEQLAHLSVAIDKLYAFLEKGGSVAPRLPQGAAIPEADAAKLAQAARAFESIKSLEQSIERKLLPGEEGKRNG